MPEKLSKVKKVTFKQHTKVAKSYVAPQKLLFWNLKSYFWTPERWPWDPKKLTKSNFSDSLKVSTKLPKVKEKLTKVEKVTSPDDTKLE